MEGCIRWKFLHSASELEQRARARHTRAIERDDAYRLDEML
jgi:hypothetical protein